jgi:hypothetical protein
MTRMARNQWEFEHFSSMGSIPSAVNLTTYGGGPAEFMVTPLEEMA